MTRRSFLKLAWISAAAFVASRVHLDAATMPVLDHQPAAPAGKAYPMIYPVTYAPEPKRVMGDKKFKLWLMSVLGW
jgi:hypothetical protein